MPVLLPPVDVHGVREETDSVQTVSYKILLNNEHLA